MSSTAPLFDWLNSRSAGLLLHPSSLPGNQGIGVLDNAIDDLLAGMQACGLRHWQLCPLGPTGFGDSPYQCFSSFAGNPYFIDLAPLVTDGLLSPADLVPLQALSQEKIDYGLLYQHKWPLLFKAHQAWTERGRKFAAYGDFDDFVRSHQSWLDPYAMFMALKQHIGGDAWWNWPEDIRFLSRARESDLWQDSAIQACAEAHQFFQYLFFGQWAQVRRKAAAAGVEIIGDLPIFVAPDSADVWSRPELFQVDSDSGQLITQAGVPPDYFSAEGQLWGNPLYDWSAHQAEDYAWWLDRLRANLHLCDILRIDHFRGFDTYWSIPAGESTAINGTWQSGPGLDFFTTVKSALPDCRLIAEDLGELAPSVVELRHATGLPGMTILQFAFGGGADNLYLPHNLTHNSVVYPGTHDNDTSLGWYHTADEKTRDHARRYLRVSGENMGWDLIRAAYGSVSRLAIVPLQDFLSLGSEARLNTPGHATDNWQWRYAASDWKNWLDTSAPYLRELTELTGR
jgi:4-alpha-glucanotransferase